MAIVLEAQVMGLLSIVSDANGLPENIIHNYTGWVVPKMAPKLLANCIKKFYHPRRNFETSIMQIKNKSRF